MTKRKSPAAGGAENVIALFAQRWPRAFAVRESQRRPLKVGIQADLLAALDGVVTAAELGDALGSYTGNSNSLRKLFRAGTVRLDLNGAPAGEVTPEEAIQARFALSQLLWRQAARRGEGRRVYDDD